MEELFSTKNVVLLVAAVGGVSGILGILKTVPNNLWILFKQQYVHSVTLYRHSGTYEDFNNWFYENHKDKFKHVEIESENEYPDLNSETNIMVFQKEGKFFIRFGGGFLFVNKFKLEIKTSNSRKPFLDAYQIFSLNRKRIQHLLKDIEAVKKKEVKISVYTNNSYGDWFVHQKIDKKNLSTVVIDEGIKKTIVDDMSNFLSSKGWYLERGIPYNRGYIFEGKPGNGKTSLSISLASYFNKEIYSIDLITMENDTSLKNAFKNIKDSSLLLIEDVDKAFNKRDGENKGITFSCLLNCLNGVYSKQGVITIMATNHIENLDPALIRSGRIDMKVNIPNPDINLVNQYLNMFYSTNNILLKNYKNTLCMADVQNVCIQNRNNREEAIKLLEDVYEGA